MSVRIYNAAALLALALVTVSCKAETYWVSTQGSNQNDCLSIESACASIRRVVLLAKSPGDVVNILSGTYQVSDDASGDKFFNIPVAVRFKHSGTKENHITVQAAPGHEGKVIIDANEKYIPFLISGHDYITIKDLQIKNAHTVAIVSRGKSVRVADEKDFSIGIRILNNYIFNTVSKNSHSNSAAIKADNSKDWQIINNRIDRVTVNGRRDSHANGIMGFNLWNNTIANNRITDAHNAILWKDHNVLSDNGDKIKYHHGATHKFNEISNVDRGISLISGGRSDEASNHIISNNILYDFDIGILVNMSNALHSGKNLTIEHNILDGSGHKNAICSSNDAIQNQRMKGNIFYRCMKYSIDLKDENKAGVTGNFPTLTASNYNIFTAPFKVNVDRIGEAGKTYKSLSDWQIAVSSEFKTLNLDDEPDANSFMLDGQSLFRNAEQHDYRYTEDSVALNIVKNSGGKSVNAGPYEKGTEVVGPLTSSWVSNIK